MDSCPKCGEQDINIEMRGHNPNIKFDDNGNGISALSFSNSKDTAIMSAECGSCHTKLKPTKDGFREVR